MRRCDLSELSGEREDQGEKWLYESMLSCRTVSVSNGLDNIMGSLI